MLNGTYQTPRIDLTGIRVMGRPVHAVQKSYINRLAQRDKLDLPPIRA